MKNALLIIDAQVDFMDLPGSAFLAEANGLKLELGSELEDMRNFCVIGDNIFVPEDKKIDVYSSLRKIAEIECDFVTENSILESCKSGIICQTDDQIFLINKI
jgi:hypothetical protein